MMLHSRMLSSLKIRKVFHYSPGAFLAAFIISENEEQSKGEFPTNTTYVMILLTILLLVTRVGSLILILRNKHALLACTVLAVPIFIFVSWRFIFWEILVATFCNCNASTLLVDVISAHT